MKLVDFEEVSKINNKSKIITRTIIFLLIITLKLKFTHTHTSAKGGYTLDARQHQTEAVRGWLCPDSMDSAGLPRTEHY